jgi:dihydroorotate dehydrogenase electron transfer subunit
MAWSPEDTDAPLATPLFAAQIEDGRFQSAPPVPTGWEPGAPRTLSRPLGNGFAPPANLRRLALAAVDESAARLLPLLPAALENGAAVALFCDASPPSLPLDVEINPLASLPEALAWADFLAIDLRLDQVARLPRLLGLQAPPSALPCRAQALVAAPMPCAGLSDCAACAVQTRRGWQMVCRDGPVFDAMELLVFGF